MLYILYITSVINNVICFNLFVSEVTATKYRVKMWEKQMEVCMHEIVVGESGVDVTSEACT